MRIKSLILLAIVFAASAGYGAESSPATESGWVIISGEYCNLRSRPDSASARVRELPKFTPVKVLDEYENEYHKVETKDGEAGWAHETVLGQYGYASVMPGLVNWREGPSKEAKKKYEVDHPDYYPLRVLDRQDDYVQIQDFEKDRAWIHHSLLSTKPYCIVTTDKAAVRVGAGEEYDVRFWADRKVVLQVISTQGDWLEVKHMAGSSGWINKDDVWGAKQVALAEMSAASQPATAATQSTRPSATRRAAAANTAGGD